MHGIALIQCTPVIGLDLWEHAYLTPQYEGDKGAYVDRFWTHLNWGKA
jgi:superoxide dismutase